MIQRKVSFKNSLSESARATAKLENGAGLIEFTVSDQSLCSDIFIKALPVLLLTEADVKCLGLLMG
jgi:hypothetical protein